MRIALASDLHNEFYEVSPPLEKADADVLILAGDIETVKSHNDRWWDAISCDYSKVIYIRGNHEYYGTYYSDYPDLYFPDNIVVVGRTPRVINYKGVRFFAGTMWTDLSNPLDAHLAKTSMNDYRKIKYSREQWWFTPEDTTREFVTFKTMLDEAVPDVVISHHLPSYGSVNEKYKNDRLNAAYATEMDIRNARLWVHGHTHEPCDYVKQDCRIVCNPKGYPGERQSYKPKVIEI